MKVVFLLEIWARFYANRGAFMKMFIFLNLECERITESAYAGEEKVKGRCCAWHSNLRLIVNQSSKMRVFILVTLVVPFVSLLLCTMGRGVVLEKWTNKSQRLSHATMKLGKALRPLTTLFYQFYRLLHLPPVIILSYWATFFQNTNENEKSPHHILCF